MHRNGLYAIGARLKDVDSDVATAPRGMFALERFAEAEHLRGNEFTVPPDFRMEDVLHGAFGPHLGDPNGPYEVTVEFSAAKAIFVSSRTWHPTQAIETLSDGRVRLRFRAPHLAPVVSWILEWGPHARAIAPNDLVAQVRSELMQALQQYEHA
ncbi:MAG TPA: WYL domain-containing protein [Kofleriaceae bacterium]|nr:WYL domain-containing protein [Kofleriaceae bacterium]